MGSGGGIKVNLGKIKSIFPDFQISDFNLFDKITFLKWEVVFYNELWEEHRNLILVMASSMNCKILMEFIEVHSLQLQGNGQISGF